MSGSCGYGNGSVPVLRLTGNTGGPIGPNVGNINIIGTSPITVTGNAGTNTLTISSTSLPAMVWESKIADFAIASNHGYICSTAPVIATLPVVAAVGDIYRLLAASSNSVQIAQNAGQQIIFGNLMTTLGTGTITSTALGDTIELVCVVANTGFMVLSSNGNFNVL